MWFEVFLNLHFKILYEIFTSDLKNWVATDHKDNLAIQTSSINIG